MVTSGSSFDNLKICEQTPGRDLGLSDPHEGANVTHFSTVSVDDPISAIDHLRD